MLEASGGYELTVVGVLGAAGLSVVVVQPRQVRDLARASGQLAKTDDLDVHVLALGQLAEPCRASVREA